MRNSWYKKGLAIAIVILFCISIIPEISSKKSYLDLEKKIIENPSENIEYTSLTFYIIDENGKKQNIVDISLEEANSIFEIFNNLKHRISYEPDSDSTQALKTELIDLLDEISGNIKKTDVH